MRDQSFQALVSSLAAHIILAIIFIRFVPQFEMPDFSSKPVEFTVAEPIRHRPRVKDVNIRPDNDVDRLREQADLLSKYTRRVREQMVAQRHGQTTRNRSGEMDVEADEMRANGVVGAGADMKVSRELVFPGQGPKAGKEIGASPMGRDIIVGSSTITQIIPGMKKGFFTALNTDRFTYYSFYNRVDEQLFSRWNRNLRRFAESLSEQDLRRLAAKDWVTEVDVHLNRRGEIVRVVLMRASGERQIDELWLNGFAEAAPFTNPPAEMAEEDGYIHLRYGIYLLN